MIVDLAEFSVIGEVADFVTQILELSGLKLSFCCESIYTRSSCILILPMDM